MITATTSAISSGRRSPARAMLRAVQNTIATPDSVTANARVDSDQFVAAGCGEGAEHHVPGEKSISTIEYEDPRVPQGEQHRQHCRRVQHQFLGDEEPVQLERLIGERNEHDGERTELQRHERTRSSSSWRFLCRVPVMSSQSPSIYPVVCSTTILSGLDALWASGLVRVPLLPSPRTLPSVSLASLPWPISRIYSWSFAQSFPSWSRPITWSPTPWARCHGACLRSSPSTPKIGVS